MKSKISLIALLTLAACGGSTGAPGECAEHPLIGTWANEADSMTFSANCSATGTYCETTFTFPNSTATSGTALITVTSTNELDGCAPVGDNSCAYAIEGSSLAFDCGAGVNTYTKQ